ncbi:phosphoglucomutase [Treponema ruminis]|uniref:Phosphoglucomutase n=1 Tax=Treponema ruminis TaxID=744515 RepID=A0A7W8G962_9SPIR|nr:phosphoglucomutase [Treponema ruminis]MBB5226162.1 phosphoglucomutase [Treponema ruminis]
MEHNMITSASGWRKVFAISGDENDNTSQISENDSILSGIAAEVFADYIIEKKASPVVILGQDTRPTGRAICQAMLKVLVAKNIRVNYPGIIAAPEIMAYGKSASGFIYISASHNPIGHNGIKFGLDDGGVLNGTENAKLVKALNEKCASPSEIERIKAILSEHKSAKNANSPEEARDQANEVIARSQKSKVDAKSAYMAFSKEVISATGDKAGQEVLFSKIKQSISENPLGIIADMNGSARTLSIDKTVFKDAGISYYGINDEPGRIVHAIIPEPENLVWAASEMERLQKEGHSEVKLGYMPDCDGDRGNIVFWNEKTGKAEVLKAQEVFALSVLSELSYMKYLDEVSGSNYGKNLAVAANCPTSMRIDEVTKAFGASLFRAEVGEANVVNLARKKRDEGFTVRILGEGSNGGNITHPAAVRDPLNTIFALVKLLVLRDSEEGGKKIKGLFHIWCDSQNLPYNNDFTLLDVIETLPVYTTTGVAEERAILKIKTTDHSVLKANFQKIFEEEWNCKKSQLSSKYGIEAYEAIGTNGTEENRKLTDYSKNGKGGLKILFTGKDKLPLAYIWMRGSGTEPVFRVLCDVKGNNSAEEHELLDWERSMILKADNL